MYALKFNNLKLAYNSRIILDNFNATIQKGEFVGIFGPNGAGKSTLLRAILGLVPTHEGAIQLFGKPAQRGNPEIGYMPQLSQTIYVGRMSGRARIAASINGFKWGMPFINKKQQQDIMRVLTLVNAQDYAERPYAELSGGERQRLLLAQALLSQPKILLLDEPLTNLDPHHQEVLIKLVAQIRSELQVTVLFTGHDLNPLLGVMDKIIYIVRGHAAIGTVDEVVTKDKLSWLYGTPMDVIRYQNRMFVISHERGEITDAAYYHPHDRDV